MKEILRPGEVAALLENKIRKGRSPFLIETGFFPS